MFIHDVITFFLESYECENVRIITIENTTNAIGALHYLTHDVGQYITICLLWFFFNLVN